MTTRIPHFIDGKRTELASTRTADVMNPSTGQVQSQVVLASAADVDTAVTSAVEAQKEWAAWNPQRRARVMMKFIELVNAHTEELAELLSLEHGNPLTLLATAEAGVVPFLLASLRHHIQRPLVIVTPNAARAQQLVEGLAPFEAELWPAMTPVLSFEPNDVSPYHEISPMRALAQERVAVGYRLSQGFGVAAVVVSAPALLLRTLDAQTLDEEHRRELIAYLEMAAQSMVNSPF